MLRLLAYSSAVTLLLALAACRGGTTAEGCPRAAFGDWTRERASAPEFALSLCIPAGWHRAGELAWERRSAGARILVVEQLGHIGALGERQAVLAPCRELGVGCAADSVEPTRIQRRLRTVQGWAAVLETARLADRVRGRPAVSVALLRVEVGADQWVVVRAVQADSTRLAELVRALESVRMERVGRTSAPGRRAGGP